MSQLYPENKKVFNGISGFKRFKTWKDKNDVLIRNIFEIGEKESSNFKMVVNFDYNSCYGKGY